MKIAKTSIVLLVILVALVFGSRWYIQRAYDRFNNTAPSFTLDKAEYRVGDTVTLTLMLHGAARVRFYENLEYTLHVWPAFRVPYRDTHTVLSDDGIREDTIVSRSSGAVHTYELRQDKPLAISLIGALDIGTDGETFVLEFPMLNRRFTIDKLAYTRALALEIHGYLRPVKPWPGDSMEDYVDAVQLVIGHKA